MSHDANAEIAELREEIRRHDRKYEEAAPEITDLEYDRLMDRLKKLEAENPDLVTPDSPTQRIAYRPVEGLVEVKHRVPMLSIDNKYSLDELRTYGERVAKLLPGEQVDWVVELKIDGVAVSLIYENGLLIRGVDRGDGFKGAEITHNVRTIKGIPLRLNGKEFPSLLEVRGEIYMTNSGLVRFNEKQKAKIEKGDKKAELLKNTRNAVAGSIHQLDPRICDQRRLRFFCHSVGETTGLRAKTHIEFLQEMKDFGLSPTPNAECFPSFTAAVEHCEQRIERLHEFDFEIDGLVLKVNRFDQRDRLGSTSKSPRWVIAYKFEKYEATTKLNAIRVQVGKTGAITPVADLEPVELVGVTISRASLHNADEIERKDIRPGDTVVVERAGKVIPHIVRVEKHLRKEELAKFEFPTMCPECSTVLVHQKRKKKKKTDKASPGEHIYCPNFDCPARIKERIRYYASRKAMNIEELGDEIIDALVKSRLALTYGDLYRLKPEKLIDKLPYKAFGERKASEIIQSISESKDRGLAYVLYGLAIPQVGGLQAVRLAETFRTMNKLLAAEVDAIAKVSEIGPIFAEIVHDCLHDDLHSEDIEGLKRTGVVLHYVDSHDLDILRKKKVPQAADAGYDARGMKTRIQHFVGKDAMGIRGLGNITIAMLIDENLVHNYTDLYCLGPSQLSNLRMPMRTKETQNLLSAIEKSKEAGLTRLLNALSIHHVGWRNAAILSDAFGSMDSLQKASLEDIERALRDERRIKKNDVQQKKKTKSKDAGVIAKNVHRFLHDEKGIAIVEDLVNLGVKMTELKESRAGERKLEGKIIVVTGTLQKYSRDEIQELIARHGGHAASSVSKNTDYLVAGENAGSKLAKAKELGIPVIMEEEFETLIQ